ncbi:MAG: ABC transporter substrate-binding protein [Actinomycetaceae bacterium]|nr:ABC transporter substrate-binding protein [Actinomycetaceae bacterium]
MARTSLGRPMTVLVSIIALCSVMITGCSSLEPDTSPPTRLSKQSHQPSASYTPDSRGFDVSGIKEDPDISRLLPDKIKITGELLNGAQTDYAPAEFLQSDGITPTGYDVDIVRALGKVLGVEGKTKHCEFDSLLPRIGTKYHIGVSSLTITAEREEKVNLVSYMEVSFQFGVPRGNPQNFHSNKLCGSTIGVQADTAQYVWLEKQSQQCVKMKKPPITVMSAKQQSDITTKVASGQYDAMLADAPVISWTVQQTNSHIEEYGEVFSSALVGVAVAKADQQLTEAIQQALQKLMDDGVIEEILAHYGTTHGALTKAELNPPPTIK